MAENKLPIYLPAVKECKALQITDARSLQIAANMGKNLQEMRKMVVDDFKEVRTSTTKAQKQAIKQEKKHLDAIDKALDVIRQRALEYAQSLEDQGEEFPETEGIFLRKLDAYEVTDKHALIQAVAMGELPETLLDINQKVLKGLLDAGLLEEGATKNKKLSVVVGG